MVILIGGSSHVGKTLLAQALLEKYNYPYLSLDHLKMGLIRSGMTNLTVNDDYEMRYFLWPIAAEMIKTAIENKQNLIVEGCYIPKEWKESFADDNLENDDPNGYLRQICAVFVVMGEDYIRTHASDIEDYANIIEHRIGDEIDIERLIKCSADFKEDCIENGTDCIEISENYDVDDLVLKIQSLVEMKIRNA